ncbi:hypothetical protein PG2022B_1698 [Bifidobacterium animalis subsp. animalis]|nr:hypothetical protein PG2022B_1698 [Bifidobacterium animalis subsp. animalis]
MYRFQSTPPRREVTEHYASLTNARQISIHTSPKGGDHKGFRSAFACPISIHTSPKGGDRMR